MRANENERDKKVGMPIYFDQGIQALSDNGCSRINRRFLIDCFLKLDWMRKFRFDVKSYRNLCRFY